MAKTPKLKQSKKAPSAHSRAARRAASPSINTDKSLKRAPRPDSSALSHRHHHGPPQTPGHHGAGITKRKAKAQPLKRQQRLRQEKGLARAEAVLDQFDKKMERSKGRRRTVRERRGAWDDVNGRLRRKTAVDEKRAESGLENEEHEEDWVAEDSDEELAEKVDRVNVGDGAVEVTMTIDPGPIHSTDDDDVVT